MSYFQQDSPQFRSNLLESELSLIQMCQIFRSWSDKGSIVHTKGEEYCISLKSLYSSIEEHSQAQCLSIYKPYLQEISETLNTILACNEGIVFSIKQVFTT
jgi:hypothetical protein